MYGRKREYEIWCKIILISFAFIVKIRLMIALEGYDSLSKDNSLLVIIVCL